MPQYVPAAPIADVLFEQLAELLTHVLDCTRQPGGCDTCIRLEAVTKELLWPFRHPEKRS